MALGFALLSLLPARAGAVTLKVTTVGNVHIPADGKTVMPVQIELLESAGPAKDGTPITGSVTGDVELLTPTVATVGGKGTLFVKAKSRPGKAELKVKAEQQDGSVQIEIDPVDLDLATIFGRLGSFFALMMLLSLGAEKGVDLLKFVIVSVGWPRWRPKPRLGTYLGKDKAIATLADAELTTIHRLMIGPPATTATSDDKRVAIEAEDVKRAEVESQWTWGSRLAAAAVGVALARCFHIDLLALLAPAGVHVSERTGHVLTGLGASAGAAFWQDMLDKMTAAKKELGGKAASG